MEQKRIRLAAGEIPYLEAGSGLDVLFLHGALATSRAYIPLLTKLAQTYHVIAPVHPGHGESFSIPNDWKLIDIVRFYQDFLLEINVSPAILIGHSFGGTLSLLLASCGIGKHVIVMDAPCLPFDFALRDYSKALVNEAKDIFRNRSNTKQLDDTARAAKTLLETIVRHPKDIGLAVQTGPRYTIIQNLQSITIPVDILWGEDDAIVPFEIGRYLHSIIPHARITSFPKRSHNYPVTDPEFTYRELVKVI